jgi:dTDP-L-rhamnose 4-epimerase
MRVLVTGGAGFIGSHLVDRFLQQGFQVRVLDSLEPRVHRSGCPPWLPTDVEFIHGDVTDRVALLAALQGVDVVSHQAAYQDYMLDFSRFLHVNALGTALLFELIVQHRLPVKKIVVASSQAVYGEGQFSCVHHGFFQPPSRSNQQFRCKLWEVCCPLCGEQAIPLRLEEQHSNPYNQYAVSKLAEEKVALGLGWLHGLPTVALRYSITQGKRQSVHNHYSGICRIFCSRAMRQLPLIVYEDGRQTRDFIHVEDVVEANMLVLEKDEANFHAFNVGSGRSISVLEYAEAVLGRVPGAPGIELSGEYRRGDNRHSVSNVEKLKQLGWRPQRSLADILDDFLDWLRSTNPDLTSAPDAYAEMRHAGVVLDAAS